MKYNIFIIMFFFSFYIFAGGVQEAVNEPVRLIWSATCPPDSVHAIAMKVFKNYIESNTNIFESDGVAFNGGVGFGFVMEEDDEEEKNESKEVISDGEDMEEQKKVLKVDTPKAETPVEDEVEDEVDVDMGGDIADVDFGEEETEEDMGDESMEGEEGDEDGDTKKIQKYHLRFGLFHKLKCLFNLFRIISTTKIQKHTTFTAIMCKCVKRCHSQSSTISNHTNVTL